MNAYSTIAAVTETAALVARIDANASADMADVMPDGPQRLVELVATLSDWLAERFSMSGIRLATVTDEATVIALASLGMSPFGIEQVGGTVADMVRSNYRFGSWGASSLKHVALRAREVTTVRDGSDE